MTRAILLALSALAAYRALRAARDAVADARLMLATDDPYAEPIPMAAWDGTARYDENSRTIRIRWSPTTTMEV